MVERVFYTRHRRGPGEYEMSGNPPAASGMLQNIIVYLCFKANPLSTTKLTKLVYLADVYHVEMFGPRLTDVPFKHYRYGPWAPDVEREFEQLCALGIVEEKAYTTRAGRQAIVPRARVRETTVELPATAFEVLKAVIEDWGRASTEEVTSFAKTTLPFVGTDFDDEIDFARVDPVVDYARTHGVSIKDAATALVEENPELAALIRR
jgi:uncharacterized phage-associated protein